METISTGIVIIIILLWLLYIVVWHMAYEEGVKHEKEV